MNKLKKCNLIFIKEILNEEDIEDVIIDKKIRIGKVSDSKYYQNLNNGREINLVGFIEMSLTTFSDGELRFIDFDNKRYKCERVEEVKNKQLMLTLGEYK